MVVVSRDVGRKLIASNKKARHDYTVLKTYEAGIVLAGTEVKSLREGRVSLVDAFAQESDGELLLHGLHIAEYGYGTWTNHAAPADPQAAAAPGGDRPDPGEAARRRGDPGAAVDVLQQRLGQGRDRRSPGAAARTTSARSLAERDANREIARELGRRLKGRRPAGEGRRPG